MRRSQLGRSVLAVGILVHFVVLALNALPGSRFIDVLYPYYGWYPERTGQAQIWSMYQYPDKRSEEYELVARFDDGRETRPWGGVHDISPRSFYFLEALFYRNDSNAFANRLLNVMRERWPSEPKPRSMSVQRSTTPINRYAEVPTKGIYGLQQQQSIDRRW